MDTSKQYIKMCDCPEIQEQYNSTDFNFLWDYTLRYDYDHDELKYKEYRKIEVAGFPFLGQHIFETYDGYEWSCIWLPSQDQLQEMHHWYPNVYGIAIEFNNYIQETQSKIAQDILNSEQLPSMGQLWLAFVMKEKYSKRWLTDSQEWVII